MLSEVVPAAKVPVEDIRKLSDDDFTLWIKRVEAEARADAYARAITMLDYHAARAGTAAGTEAYGNGRLDGIEFAATLTKRLSKNPPPSELIK
jgi:hypothetical protein